MGKLNVKKRSSIEDTNKAVSCEDLGIDLNDFSLQVTNEQIIEKFDTNSIIHGNKRKISGEEIREERKQLRLQNQTELYSYLQRVEIENNYKIKPAKQSQELEDKYKLKIWIAALLKLSIGTIILVTVTYLANEKIHPGSNEWKFVCFGPCFLLWFGILGKLRHQLKQSY